jgi:hypothetical protein
MLRNRLRKRLKRIGKMIIRKKDRRKRRRRKPKQRLRRVTQGIQHPIVILKQQLLSLKIGDLTVAVDYQPRLTKSQSLRRMLSPSRANGHILSNPKMASASKVFSL